MDIPQQRIKADIILAKLETIDPNAMLAGGAPRDWSFGNKAADLDFYIYIGSMSLSQLHHKFYDMGLIDSANFLDDDNYIKSNRFKWVLTFYYDGQKVQIMVMSRPVVESVLQHFSLSICRVWYKNQTIYTTPEFLKTVEEKVIRQAQPAFGCGYISKIRDKFPDYQLVLLSEENMEVAF